MTNITDRIYHCKERKHHGTMRKCWLPLLCYNAFSYKPAKCNKYYKMHCDYMKCNKKLCNMFCNKPAICNNLLSKEPSSKIFDRKTKN